MNSVAVLVALVLYNAILIGIGIWASRRTKDEADFLVGGRGVGPIVSGLSYAASTSSAWVLLGYSGFVYATGLSALWMTPGILLGYVVVWFWFGPRLREESARLSHVTLTDFLAARTSGAVRSGVRLIASLLILFCFVFYIAAQFQAAGRAFESAFGLDLTTSVLIGAGVVVAYSLLGGFWAVSVTDTVQGAVMALVALGLPVLALVSLGGPGPVLVTLAREAPAAYLSWTGDMAPLAFAGFAAGLFSIGLGSYGQPHLLNRLMAVRDEAARRRGALIAIGWGLAVYAGMTVLALCGRALSPDLAEAESIFYVMAGQLLPSALAGVVVAAILSAVMSTVDSILLAAAGAVSHDLGAARRWPGAQVLVARVVMLVIAIGAVILTLTTPASIFGRVLFAWSALGAAFGPIVVARVAGIEPRGGAIIVAMLTGFSLTVLFNQVLPSGPGAIGERLLPWLPALVILFLFRQTRRGEPAPS